MKIIGFTGTSGTGKTSLAEELQRRYPDIINVCDEGTHYAAKKIGFEKMTDCPKDKFYEFEQLLIQNHLNKIAHNDKPILITDRTIYDIYIYTMTSPEIPDSFKDYVYFLCQSITNSNFYDEIIYFPVIDVDLNDGFRSGDKYRYKVLDYTLNGVYQEFGLCIKSYTKNSTLEERIDEFVVNYIDGVI
jgi:hypothetical protein